jgi:hypothetical protein
MEKIGMYKSLIPMARDILGIPASSVDAERAFSSARDMIPYQRNRLKGLFMFLTCVISYLGETIQANLCLRDWSIKDAEEYFDHMIADAQVKVPHVPTLSASLPESEEKNTWLEEFSDEDIEWFASRPMLNEELGLDMDVSAEYLKGSMSLSSTELPVMT